jgi:hypothetical protein
MKRSVLAGAIVLALASPRAHAQVVPATWDGGNGAWESAKWNGGQTAVDVFGDNRVTNGAFAITIGGGSQVTYDAGPLRDLRPQSNTGPTSLTIKEGASLTLDSFNTDTDGVWTQFDADLSLDNGTFRRKWTPGGSTEAGGINMFGSWRSVQDQQIDIHLTNGGRIENDGQIWFGADEEHALGLGVSVEIDNGSLDLTGGTYPESNNDNVVMADLAMFFGRDFGKGAGSVGSGEPKGEDYEINFRGPGTITVDHSGIWVYDQDEFTDWTATQSTYEVLWDRGILKSKGRSGAGNSGLQFANFFDVTGTSGADNYVLTRKSPAAVTWDGGTGNWSTDLKWNGGQDAATVTGTNRGTDGGHAIVIDGSKPGGADVTYDQNSDFQVRSNNGISSITVNNGGMLTLHSNGPTDGNWTRWGIDLILDNGTFRRTADGVNSLSSGAFIIGGYDQKQGMEIDISLSNGARFENHGQVWFGAVDSDDALGLEVTMTINDGTVDLTGGDSEPLLGVGIEPDLLFAYTYRPDDFVFSDEKYAINFTGPGTMTVDHSGIYTVNWDEAGTPTAAPRTYQQLWDLGILQANGLSGLDGATFGDFFSTTGALGSDNYMLTSLLPGGGGGDGDFDGDGDVDGNDFLVWQRGVGSTHNAADLADWMANFGPGAVGAAGAVPEPAALAVALVTLGGLGVFRRRRAA